MAKPTAEEFLAHQAELGHHGVLGMHWGSHKAPTGHPAPSDIYAARARISERNVKIEGHAKQDSAYSANKVKQLRLANRADSKIANRSANKREIAAKIQAGAGIAAGAAGYTLAKLSEHGSSAARGKLALASIIASGATLALAGSAAATQASANKVENKYHNSRG